MVVLVRKREKERSEKNGEGVSSVQGFKPVETG
jgi:hypothetical protein